MLPCICPVTDHRGRQNVVRTSVTHSAIASCATFLFLPHVDVICVLLLDKCTETWNLFVKYIMKQSYRTISRKMSDCYNRFGKFSPRQSTVSTFDQLVIFDWTVLRA